jgi:hypothetical protein
MLEKLAEDAPFQLTLDLQIGRPTVAGGPPSVTKPVDVAMELIAPLFAASDADVRYHAVRTFNVLVPFMPQWLIANIDGYVHGLLALAASAPDARIQRVCSRHQLSDQQSRSVNPRAAAQPGLSLEVRCTV